MDLKQLYNSATHDERYQMLEHMLRALESRQHRIVFTGNQWVRNRRRGYRAHFINNRRGRHARARVISLVTFAVVLVSVSAATFAFAAYAPPQLGMPVLFFHLTALLGVLAFKPYNMRKSQEFSPLQK